DGVVDDDGGLFSFSGPFEPQPTAPADNRHRSCMSAKLGSDPLAPRNVLDKKIRSPIDRNEGSMTNPAAAEGAAWEPGPSNSFVFFDCSPTHQARSRLQYSISSSLGSPPAARGTV